MVGRNLATDDVTLFGWWSRRRLDMLSAETPDNSCVMFLKPELRDGISTREVQSALTGFGFETTVIGSRRFTPFELRLMWRNLRSLEAWHRNAEQYQENDCLILSVRLPRGRTLAALDFLKRAIRVEYGDAREHIRNFFHAPDDFFEEALHRRLLGKGTPVGSLTTSYLSNMEQRCLEWISVYRGFANTFALESAFWDNNSADTGRLLGLNVQDNGVISGIDELGPDGLYRAVKWTRKSAPSAYRLMYDATYAGGSSEAFLKALGRYRAEYAEHCRKHELQPSIRYCPDCEIAEGKIGPPAASKFRYLMHPIPDVLTDVVNAEIDAIENARFPDTYKPIGSA